MDSQRRRVVLGLGLEGLAVFRVGGLEGGRVRQGDLALAPHHDRLQVLGSHDRADAGAAGGPVAVVHDGGKQHLLFPGRPDHGRLGLGVGLAAQGVVGFMGGLAPQVAGGPQLGAVPVDPEIDRLRPSGPR